MTKEGERRTVKQAKEVVEKYAKDKTKEALGRVEMEMHGEGCGCPQCKGSAVRTVNSWLAFLFRGKREALDQVEFGLEDGTITRPQLWQDQDKV